MYTVFFISFVVSSTCFGCYLHPSSGVQLQRTAIGCVWFGVLLHWRRYWFGTALQLSVKLVSQRCAGGLNSGVKGLNDSLRDVFVSRSALKVKVR
jgi:hypothetical protein